MKISKKYLDQPELYVIIEKGGYNKSPKGFSRNNVILADGYQDTGPNAIQISEITSRFRVTIRNNSEYDAYNIKLLKPINVTDCIIEPKIDYFKPIKSNESEVCIMTFTWEYEGTGGDAAQLAVTGSDFFTKNKVILEYTNVKKTRFFTEFDVNKTEPERNIFHRKNPLSEEVKI